MNQATNRWSIFNPRRTEKARGICLWEAVIRPGVYRRWRSMNGWQVMAVVSTFAILCACSFTPDEIRQEKPLLTAEIPGSPADTAKCVQQRFENKGNVWMIPQPAQVREWSPSHAEFVVLGGSVFLAIADFRSNPRGTTVKLHIPPNNLAYSTTVERFGEAVKECGGSVRS